MAIGTIQANGQQVFYLPYYLQQFQSSKDLTIYGKKEIENTGVDKKDIEEAAIKPIEKNEEQEKTNLSNNSRFDASAYKLDLTLNFSPENLKKSLTNVLNGQKQLPKNDEQKDTDGKNKTEITPFLAVDLSVKAERVQKEPLDKGNGQVQNVHIRQSRTIINKDYVTYRLDQIKLQIQRRQSERVNAQLDIVHHDGYRIIRQRIAQRYREDLSIKAELLDKFDSTAQKVAEQKPEVTVKFLNTTDKLVQDQNVSGKTISKFFDVVESYVDKTKQALHGRIDKFLDTISKDFNISKEKLDEMRLNLHAKVDQFFDSVNKMLGTMKNEKMQSLETNKNTEPLEQPKQVANVTQIA